MKLKREHILDYIVVSVIKFVYASFNIIITLINYLI